MKKIALTILFTFLAAYTFGQPGQREEILLDDPDDVVSLKIEINSTIDQREQLLHDKQEWNNSGADVHLNGLSQLISNFTSRRDNARNSEAEAFWQAKLDDALAEQALWKDESPGSPRDEASKLGPQISALQGEINDLKQELRAIE